jgi:hypothetical protein
MQTKLLLEIQTTMGEYIVLRDFKNDCQIEAYHNKYGELRFVVTDGFVTDFPIFYGNGKYAMDMPETWSDLIHEWCNEYALIAE